MVEERELVGGGFWGGVWTGSPRGQKGIFLTKWRAKKGQIKGGKFSSELWECQGSQDSERIKHASNRGPPFRVTFCPPIFQGGAGKQWIHTGDPVEIVGLPTDL